MVKCIMIYHIVFLVSGSSCKRYLNCSVHALHLINFLLPKIANPVSVVDEKLDMEAFFSLFFFFFFFARGEGWGGGWLQVVIVDNQRDLS